MIITVNNKKIKKEEKIYVVADFDGTLTKGNSKTSWSVLANTNLLPEKYIEDRQKLFDEYYPIEIDTSLSFDYRQNKMKEWFKLHAELFVKYHLKEEFIKQAAKNFDFMEFREGAKEFLDYLKKNNIPLIIISAGIGNFVKAFLEYKNCMFNNIYISSNMLKFKDGICVGIEDNIIHSLNKNEVSLPEHIKDKIKNKDKIILLGDKIDDVRMVNNEPDNKLIKIIWSHDKEYKIEELKKYYDYVFSDEESYLDVINNIWEC